MYLFINSMYNWISLYILSLSKQQQYEENISKKRVPGTNYADDFMYGEDGDDDGAWA